MTIYLLYIGNIVNFGSTNIFFDDNKGDYSEDEKMCTWVYDTTTS